MERFYIKSNISNIIYNSSEDVYKDLKKIAKADQELFWLIGMNGNSNVILKECVFKGCIDSARIDFRLIFKRLLISNSVSFIIVHNHPSGNIEPSKEDITITCRLSAIGNYIGLKMLDHLIIGENNFYSFLINNPVAINNIMPLEGN